MAEKRCFKCGLTKPLTAFYGHPRMADGHLGKCMDCAKADAKAHRAANDSVRERDRERSKLPHRKAHQARVTARWLAEHPERRRAQIALGNAVRCGKVQRQPCHICGAENVEAHHPDYSRPLDVVWLCVRHHRLVHAEAA